MGLGHSGRQEVPQVVPERTPGSAVHAGATVGLDSTLLQPQPSHSCTMENQAKEVDSVAAEAWVPTVAEGEGDIFSIDRRSQGAYRHICLIGSGGIQR